jgi:ferredoxin-NADP reductase
MAERLARTRTVVEIAPQVLVVDAEPVEELVWRAGQFVSLRCGDLAHADPDARRSYSIASLPGEGRLELLVKLVPGGVGSLFFERLRPGAELHFTGPMGFFVCELQHPGDAVFAATGTGIAAALPMIRETLSRPREPGRVVLYWGMRDQSELYWVDRLDALLAAAPRFRHHICLSRPQADPAWQGVTGRINQHVLDALPGLHKPTFYLVGNGNMVRELKKLLIDRGVDRKRQIRQEVFYPATEP